LAGPLLCDSRESAICIFVKVTHGSHLNLVLNETFDEDGAIVYREACKRGCEGIVSKRLGPTYRRGRSPYWVKVTNPKAPAVKREVEEDWNR
jgi:ATP-dependent DNA ligase